MTLTRAKNMKLVNFKQLTLSNKPNFYLVCPPAYCNIKSNAISKTYPIGVIKLVDLWREIISEQPKLRLLNSDPEKNQYQYVQYSKVFKFPDYIDIEFIPIADNQSTLAIYSRARFGYYDFQVNKKRVIHLLNLIETSVNQFLTKS